MSSSSSESSGDEDFKLKVFKKSNKTMKMLPRPRKVKNRKSAYKDHPPYEILDGQRSQAKGLNVSIEPSKNKMKKIDVFVKYPYKNKKGKTDFYELMVASIGGYYQDGIPYGDYYTYEEDGLDRYGNEVDAEKKKKLYLARHEHEKKFVLYLPQGGDFDNIEEFAQEGFKIKPIVVGTPSYYSDVILWDDNKLPKITDTRPKLNSDGSLKKKYIKSKGIKNLLKKSQ